MCRQLFFRPFIHLEKIQEVPFSVLAILASLTLFQLGLMILFLFSSSRGKVASNKLLACFFLLLFVNVLDGILQHSGFYIRYPELSHLEDGFVFLFGPVLYFYTISIVYNDFGFRSKDILHILPFLLFTVAYHLFYQHQSLQAQRDIQDAILHHQLPGIFYFSILLIHSHVGAYLFFAFREIRHYRRAIRNKFSDIDQISLDWLNFMLFAVSLVVVISLVTVFLPVAGFGEIFNAFIILSFLFMFAFSTLVVWKSLTHPQLFAGIEKNSTEKYATSPLNAYEKESIKDKITHLMNNEKTYLSPGITLEAFAEQVGISPRKVSQVINEIFHQNFFDFINTRRIETAQKILSQNTDTKLTVLEVMYACGFNSKSSFNTLFKQKTGYTPSEFRKIHHSN